MIGTLAAFAWLIASSVWGMTPSSAATTTTAMSVTFAPRARIAVNASWPGVSRKTTRLPSWATSLAPMCWVMPPRSPAATSVVRIASRRLVLPWSTWPMTVTIGRARLEVSRVVLLEEDFLGRRGGRAFLVAVGTGAVRGRRRLRDLVAELAGDERRGVAVDELVDRREDAALDQLADDVRGVDVEQLRELLDRDRRRQLDRATLARVGDLDLATVRRCRRDAAACGVRAGRGCRSYSLPLCSSFSRCQLCRAGRHGLTQVRRDGRLERPSERSALERGGPAGGVPAEVGTPAGQPARFVDLQFAVRRPDDPDELALVPGGPAGDARPGRDPARLGRLVRGYDALSSASASAGAFFARLFFAGAAAAATASGSAAGVVRGGVGLRGLGGLRVVAFAVAAFGFAGASAAPSPLAAAALAACRLRLGRRFGVDVARVGRGLGLRRRLRPWPAPSRAPPRRPPCRSSRPSRRSPRPSPRSPASRPSPPRPQPSPRRPRRRCGCRSASRSAARRGGRSGPRGRWPARASAPGRSRSRSGAPRRCRR